MRGKTVLIADDDADFLTVLAQRCKALGLGVQVGTDGLGALATIVREEPDLLILDIDMPAVGGMGVAQKLLSDPKLRPIPVVFCTGQSDPATIERCKALGAHYVTKGADAWPNLKPIICRLLAIRTKWPRSRARRRQRRPLRPRSNRRQRFRRCCSSTTTRTCGGSCRSACGPA